MAYDRGSRGRKRRKVCSFCVDKVQQIDYKDTASWDYKDLGTRKQMQIIWNMIEPIPGSVMHFARIREIA